MVNIKHLVAAGALAVATHAGAAFVTGNDLLKLLEGNQTQQTLALGYIAGVHDAAEGTRICAPDITLQQAADMVLQTLKAVPQERHRSADLYVLSTLSAQWPCAQPQQPAPPKKST
jgi:hypothetical protein